MGFNIEVENALVKSVSVNSERHGEAHKGVMDVKVGLTLPASKMATLLGTEEPLALWNEGGEQLLKTGSIDKISLSSEFKQHDIEIGELVLKACNLSKFEVAPTHGACFGVVFNIRQQEPTRGTIDDVLDMKGEQVHLKVESSVDMWDDQKLTAVQ